MFDDIKTYFIENILVPFHGYLKIKNSSKSGLSLDLRTAINIATSLYHLREHLPNKIRLNRNELSKLCVDYDLLGDIVNVSKHYLISRNNPQISDYNNIYEQIIVTEYKDKDGVYNDFQKSVFVKLDNGLERDLHEILINVMNMWLTILEKHNIIEYHVPFKKSSNLILSRGEKNRELDLIFMQNLSFNKKFKIQRYNYKTKSIEPVDLTNAKVSFNVYEPYYYLIDVEIIDKSENKSKLEIRLTRNQKHFVEKMKNENNKNQFLLNLAKEQKLITFLK